MNEKNIAVFIKDLFFSYNKSEQILNGLNINVKKATVLTLFGPSGCGKTLVNNQIIKLILYSLLILSI